MEIYYSTQFKKQFGKLPANIQKRFEERVELFIKNPRNPILKVHPLKGLLVGYRSFSVTGDFRVVYKHVKKDAVKLTYIGTHSQLY